MVSLDTDTTIDGYIYSESLRELEQNPERMQGVYQCTIYPDNPFAREELRQQCEMAIQPHQTLHFDQPADKNLIRFETVVDPKLLPFDDGSYLGVNDHVTLDIRVELNPSSDGEHVFVRAYLRRVSPFFDPNESIDWNSMTNVIDI